MLEGLVNISSLCGDINLGGLLKIEYLPVKWVDVATYDPIISPQRNWAHEINILGGKDWLSVPIKATKRSWIENQVTGRQGVHYSQSVSGLLPKNTPEIADELDRMSRHTFLLRVNDRNGQPWVLGTIEHPFRFSSSMSTGQKSAEFNNHSIRFSALTPFKAFGFVPAFGN